MIASGDSDDGLLFEAVATCFIILSFLLYGHRVLKALHSSHIFSEMKYFAETESFYGRYCF